MHPALRHRMMVGGRVEGLVEVVGMIERDGLTGWTAKDIIADCPLCGVHAIVPLGATLAAKQPDDTTHVCHPGFGGCNHGFAVGE